MRKTIVTAALPYANGPVHIGHLAGCYLPADIYVRFLRLKREDVLFISGTDEHGVAIDIKAQKEGKTPQEIVDFYYKNIAESFQKFGISFDHFSRTGREIHHKTAQAFFLRLYEHDAFEKIESEQYYDPEKQRFLADRYIIGTCPNCGFESAYGDQCEKCGSSLSPLELINPKSTLSDATPILKKTANWYLNMDSIAESDNFLHYAQRAENWKSNVKGQFYSWLKQGLQPRAMTRDLDWGIDVPLEDAVGKKLYVWFDAPIGYISATKEYFIERAKTFEGTETENQTKEKWRDYWQNKDSRLVHFIGKDNIVFHTIIFPMMLMMHGDYVLPENIPANEFLNLEGKKISTSRNWAVWLDTYLQDFEGKNDELRYVLTSIAPETKDSDFAWTDFQQRVNSELVAILGNFVNRVMVLSQKYFDNMVPDWHESGISLENKETEFLWLAHIAYKAELHEIVNRMENDLCGYRFRDAQAEMINMARLGNKYLAETEPWKLWKSNQDAVKGILFDALNLCYRLSVACDVFLPETAKNIRKQLNLSSLEGHIFWEDIKTEKFPDIRHPLGEAFLLFNQIDDEVIEIQRNKLMSTLNQEKAEQEDPNFSPLKPEISFDDFQKIDIRTGKITEAEKVKGADKLLQLKVDLGFETRTLVSGIAAHFNPEEIIGQNVLVLANLAPRKIRGVVSHGMVLMAENNGQLYFTQANDLAGSGSVIS